jgi:hypothetical protein
MLPALKTVLKWYCTDVDKEIKKAKRNKKKWKSILKAI